MREKKIDDTHSSILSIESPIFKDVKIALRAKLGEATLSVEELLGMKSDSIVTLDSKLNDLVELRLNGALVARGEIVAVGDNFGIRVVEIGEIS
jgi:flagellar motor switch protein FliN/FliY